MMRKIKKILSSVGLLLLSLFIRRKENWYAFGSWRGQLYIDNSRYLYEYIRKTNEDCVCIWIGNIHVREAIVNHPKTFVYAKNSFRSAIALLKCKYMFCSQMHSDDLCEFNVFRGSVITYLHHGMPVKRWGADYAGGHLDFKTKKPIINAFRKLTATDIQYDYFATSSKLHEVSNLSALDYRGCTEEKNLRSGTPRNDLLINATEDQIAQFKKMYADLLQFDSRKKIVMYLPTFRRKGTPTRSFVEGVSEKEYEQIHHILAESNAILIEKNHFAEDAHQAGGKRLTRDDIIHVDQNVNVQEMLLICDVLISDYSGAFLDYILLDRPVIHYAYDYDDYKNHDSGLYYEIEDFAAGDVVSDFHELCLSLRRNLNDSKLNQEKRKYVREKYMTYENGSASQIIYGNVVLGKEV